MPKGVYARKTVEDRFWGKVDKNGPIPAHCPELGPCWLFSGGKSNDYGHRVFHIKGRQSRAHRAGYEIQCGPIPPDLCVLHKCDNPACVRGSHLFTGTQADNNQDMKRKGRCASGAANGAVKHPERIPRGATHARAKFSDQVIQEVLGLVAEGLKQRDISTLTGVSQPYISDLVRGVNRTELTR